MEKSHAFFVHSWVHCSIFFLFFCLADIKLVAGNGSEVVSDTFHIRDFGARGNGRDNCTAAFQQASEKLQQKGGVLIIDPGTYIVGKQFLSKAFGAGSSYLSEPILSFKRVRHPISIIGVGATIKAASGLKFGSFHPVTGKKDSLRKIGNRSDYYAAAFVFIDAEECTSVSVANLIMDGNSPNMDIGPAFDADGIQLMATGIRMYNNQKVNIEDCYIHHCGLDAIIIGWTGLKHTDPIYPHTIRNVRARYNGRQGISWVGGNHLSVTGSEFSSTGKAINNGKFVVSKPCAGIDIEIEDAIIKNGLFENCYVFDNTGPGLSSIGHDTYNINFKRDAFIGTTNSALYPKTQGLSFDSCLFVGKVERIFGSSDKTKAISFKNSLFTMQEGRSPNGKVFGDHCEFYEGVNVVFDNCEFDAAKRRLPVFNFREIVFKDCKFSQDNAADFKASATFMGTTTFDMKGPGKVDVTEATFQGQIIYNKRRVARISY
ncbi:MAG: right-handed parallel beta-helix repeat-containing protein [Ferruginibacter sp.]|nr:right-handed parallel beta-helix repeat-containing protein [Ferruginibacter sp.]